jgi:hypothetical protein
MLGADRSAMTAQADGSASRIPSGVAASFACNSMLWDNFTPVRAGPG